MLDQFTLQDLATAVFFAVPPEIWLLLAGAAVLPCLLFLFLAFGLPKSKLPPLDYGSPHQVVVRELTMETPPERGKP